MVTSARPGDAEAKCFEHRRPPVARLHGARLVDDSGRPVPVGVEGELELFGPQLCVGYLDPGAQRRVHERRLRAVRAISA